MSAPHVTLCFSGSLGCKLSESSIEIRVPTSWSQQTCEQWVREYLEGAREAEELKRDGTESLVLRLRGGTVSAIVKLWSRPGWRGSLRTLTQTSPKERELRALTALDMAGLPVPKVLGSCRIARSDTPWTEALFIEDLGKCRPAVGHIKTLIRSGRIAALEEFLDQVLALTRKMLACGVIDTDHSFVNIVTTDDEKLYRIDFEIARVARPGRIRNRDLGTILGNLIGTYTFAIQPDVQRAEQFAQKLQDQLAPADAALRIAAQRVHSMLVQQHLRSGIDTQITLPWEQGK